MHVSVCAGYALTIPFSLNIGCMVQEVITLHIAFHVLCCPYSHNDMALTLSCATLDIYSKMRPIFITSRHAALALQMISELRIPVLTASFPNSLFNVPA